MNIVPDDHRPGETVDDAFEEHTIIISDLPLRKNSLEAQPSLKVGAELRKLKKLVRLIMVRILPLLNPIIQDWILKINGPGRVNLISCLRWQKTNEIWKLSASSNQRVELIMDIKNAQENKTVRISVIGAALIVLIIVISQSIFSTPVKKRRKPRKRYANWVPDWWFTND